jgi:selenide,water dikinase
VGIETGDDAAVYKLTDDLALVSTTDFFLPVVQDPFDFGQIAAANALSDVYAMGGRPVVARRDLWDCPWADWRRKSWQKYCAAHRACANGRGAALAGGHSIDLAEPLFGLAVQGIVHPDKIRRNSGAHANDLIILTKPIGIGIMSAALKKEILSKEAYSLLIRYTTMLNTPGQILADRPHVHAMTDVTGFGLLGHLLEICRGSSLAASIEWENVPFIPDSVKLAQDGILTGASTRNWDSYGAEVDLPPLDLWQRNLLTDPQTSGGLLFTASPDAAQDLVQELRALGFEETAVIGQMQAGSPRVEVQTART